MVTKRFQLSILPPSKKGWIRIVEAVISVLLLLGFIMIVLQQNTQKPELSESIYKIQHQVLREVANNYTLRNEVINYDTTKSINSTYNFIANRLKPFPLSFGLGVCPAEQTCPCEGCPSNKEIFADEIIISTNLSAYIPKKLVMYSWVKPTFFAPKIEVPPTPPTIPPEECVENWICTWNECPPSGIQEGICIDTNNCGTTKNKPAEQRSCTYTCTDSWECGAWSNKCGLHNGVWSQIRTCTYTGNCATPGTNPNPTVRTTIPRVEAPGCNKASCICAEEKQDPPHLMLCSDGFDNDGDDTCDSTGCGSLPKDTGC